MGRPKMTSNDGAPHGSMLPSMAELPSIRAILARLVVACVLPGVLAAAFLIFDFYRHERQQLDQDMREVVHSLALAVDGDLVATQAVLEALATSPHLATGNLAAFRDQARQVLSGHADNLVLSDETGQELLNLAIAAGEPLPRHGNPQHLRRVFETGRPAVSDLFMGAGLGRPLTSIDVPVRRDGRVVYDISVGILPERLAGILGRQRLPPGWIAAIFDRTGTIIARTHEPDKFIGQKGTPILVERMRAAEDGISENSTLEGIPVYGAFSRSNLAQWSVAVGVPRQTLLAKLHRTILLLSLGTTGLMTMGLLLAWRIGGGIGRAVTALSEPALALGSGGPVMVPRLRVREAAEVARALGTAADLLRQRTAERDTARDGEMESQRLLQEVIDASTSFIYIFDRQGNCLLANRQLYTLFGIPPERAVGWNRREFMPAEVAASHAANDQAVLASGQPAMLEETVPLADGVHTYLSVKFPVMDRDGRPQAVAGISTDISERKEIEAELHRHRHDLEALVNERTEALKGAAEEIRLSEERYRLMAESVRDYAIFMLDPTGHVVTWNEGARRLIGYEAGEILSQAIDCFLPAEEAYPTRATSQLELARAVAEGRAEKEGWLVRKDGTRFYADVVQSPIHDNGRDLLGFSMVIRDITESRRKTIDLQKAVESLTEANVELQRFAFIASHDLQEPLSNVTSFVQLLARDFGGKLGPEGDAHIQFIVSSAKRMYQLINDLLAYARVPSEGYVTAPVSSGRACDTAIANLRDAIAESGAEICLGDLPTVMANEVQLMQVFQNLLGNSIKFRRPGLPPRVTVTARLVAGMWQFTVTDNGIGIEPSEQDIFQIFRRLHTLDAYPGTGIGLAVCKKVIQGVGGNIWVESQPGMGSSFHFTMPPPTAEVMSPWVTA